MRFTVKKVLGSRALLMHPSWSLGMPPNYQIISQPISPTNALDIVSSSNLSEILLGSVILPPSRVPEWNPMCERASCYACANLPRTIPKSYWSWPVANHEESILTFTVVSPNMRWVHMPQRLYTCLVKTKVPDWHMSECTIETKTYEVKPQR